MENSEPLLLPALALLAGLGLLAVGLLKKWKAARLAAYTRTPIGRLRPRERQLVSGKAGSLVPITAPVSRRACVFYAQRTERLSHSHSGGRSHSRWVAEGTDAYGGFRLDDGSGGALVFPSAASLDFSGPEFSDGATALTEGEGAVRESELVLEEGSGVTVIGTPAALADVLAVVRSGAALNIPADLMASLVKLEKEGGGATPCFFGATLETVADRDYEAYAGGTASSAALFLQAGGLLALLGAAGLAYTLYSARPPAGGY